MTPVRVLLVDDNAEFLGSATHFMSEDSDIEIAGYALSGDEALKQVVRLVPDLVLMDLAMPGMSGLEATRQIKALPETPRVVILTLHDNAEYRAAAAAAGADGFVAKSEFCTALQPQIHDMFPELACSKGPKT